MSTARPEEGRTSPLTLLVGMALAGLAVFGVLALDVPNRIAALGSGNLDKFVASKATVAYGEPVDLAGRAERPPLRITAEAPIAVRSLTPKARAPKGKRLVGVELDLKNTGKVKWSVPPLSTIGVTDQSGSSYGPDRRVRRIRGARLLPAAITLDPGRSARGVVVFAVPRSAKIAMVQFIVGQGLTRTAEWTATGKAS